MKIQEEVPYTNPEAAPAAAWHQTILYKTMLYKILLLAGFFCLCSLVLADAGTAVGARMAVHASPAADVGTDAGTRMAAQAPGLPRIPADVRVDDTVVEWEHPPFVEKGMTYLPLRQTARLLGARVQWQQAEQTARLYHNGDEIIYRAGSRFIEVNGYTLPVEAPSRIENGVMLVHLRAMTEALQATIVYAKTNGRATIRLGTDRATIRTEAAANADAFLLTRGYSGIALLAENGKPLLLKGYGLAAPHARVRPDARSRIASISKTFTAAAVMRLQEQGKLRMTDPVSAYVPDFPHGDRITLHMLLSHTSGLPSAFTRAEGISLEATVEEMKKQPLRFAPGTMYHYSNNGYVLLAWIIEQQTGMSYYAFIRTQFLEPLGLLQTAEASPQASAQARVIQGFVPLSPSSGSSGDSGSGASIAASNNDNWQTANYYASQSGTGSLYATAHDLLLWAEAFRSPEAAPEGFLLAETVEQMLTAYSDRNYGYGWMLSGIVGPQEIDSGGQLDGVIESSRDKAVFFHNGSGTGYSTGLFINRGEGRVIILLGNKAGLPILDWMKMLDQAAE